jgi:hypothetical protein
MCFFWPETGKDLLMSVDFLAAPARDNAIKEAGRDVVFLPA